MTRPSSPPALDPALPSEIAGRCLAVRLRAVNRAVTAVYDEALRPLGVKISQLNLLVAIAATGRIQPTALARALHLDKSTLSRNVNKLRRSGWVAQLATDGRGQLLALTPAGEQLLAQAGPLWRQAQARAHQLLGDEGIGAIHQLHRSIPNAS